MKKLKRISLDILANDLKKLTEQEMYMTFGGNGINGYCYFYTLEYLSSQFGGSTDINGYMSMYQQEYGYSAYDMLPNVYSGTADAEYVAFTTYMFNSRYMYTDNQINQNISGGNAVMAVLNLGGNNGHSVVLQGYDSSTGQYTYVDPSNLSAGPQTQVLVTLLQAFSWLLVHQEQRFIDR